MPLTHNSITGLNALVNALQDSNVERITAVAGFPITDFMNQLLKDTNNIATWVTNEKTALEIVLGASVSGRRGAVLVKHVGMNILSDPLITAVTHRIGAGVVLFAGDDPGAYASQNEQDSRWYGNIAEVLVFDPSTPRNAYKSVIRAYELSEELSSPIIIRITDRLLKSNSMIVDSTFTRRQKSNQKRFLFDRTIWENRIREKHQRFHSNIYPILIKESELQNFTLELERTSDCGNFLTPKELEISLTPSELKSELGIISSGFVSTLVDECINETEISHISLNIVHPLPFKSLRTFINKHKKILIIEESESVIETQLCIQQNIFGKKTGLLPYGLIELEDIKYAIEEVGSRQSEVGSRKSEVGSLEKLIHLNERLKSTVSREHGQRKSICENCPFIPLYHILQNINGFIAGDIGCSIRATHAPFNAIDTGYALGSAIAVACGFPNKGIAVIGDFAFSHSGIISLINAVQIKANILIIILQNEVAAMTGGQDTYDLTKVVGAIVKNVSIFDIDKEEKETLSNLIAEKMDQSGISVICIKGKCKKYISMQKSKIF